MMCEACKRGQHWLCGMQTWCECDCDGPDGIYDDYFDAPSEYDDWDSWDDDDDPRGHSDKCTCEHCEQNYPERIVVE